MRHVLSEISIESLVIREWRLGMDDVAKVLSKLREDKAAGADDLPPRLLLQIKD